MNWSAMPLGGLASSAVCPVVTAFFLATLGFAAFETTLALFLKDTLGFAADKSYLFFAYVGLVLMLTQGLSLCRLGPARQRADVHDRGHCVDGAGLAGSGGGDCDRQE